MSNRREFLGGLVSAAVAAGQTGGSRVLGTNDRIRFGLIGAGARGMEDLGNALHCPNVEAVAVADVYTGRFAAAQSWFRASKPTRISGVCSTTRASTPS